MQVLTFRCDKDGDEFVLKSGFTKGEALATQEQGLDSAKLAENQKNSKELNQFVQTITEHSRTCDGSVVYDDTKYMIAD